MAYDEKLAERIRRTIQGKSGFSEKRMFGGLAFMLGDKMCCGVIADRLVARLGPKQSEVALKNIHVSPMDFTGRPLKGYVYIGSLGFKSDAILNTWIQQAIAFTSTLVRKSGNRSKRKTISQIDSPETARVTPLSKLVNFGPVILPEFKAMGLTTYGQLEDLGWEAVCRKWVENFPERLNTNAFIGVIATLEGISWTKVSASDKAKARGLVNKLRQEYGMPIARNKHKAHRD
ncbi:TfoX/Sxy family protein [bacterium]|nr:TfoX/Sxy family protein [bacterium]